MVPNTSTFPPPLIWPCFLEIVEVAVAPKNTTRRVPTLRELDEDLKYSVPPASDGLDMGLLTNTLVPPEMVGPRTKNIAHFTKLTFSN